MNDEDRKAFPKGFRKLSADEVAISQKKAELERQISEIDKSVQAQLAKKGELEVLLNHGPAAKAPAGEVVEVGKPDDPKKEDLSGFWVKE